MLTLNSPPWDRPATIRRWLKKPGDRLVEGEVLFEAETEDALIEVVAAKAGVLREILVPEKTTFAGNLPVARMDLTGDNSQKSKTEAKRPVPSGGVIPVLMPQAGQSMEEGTIVKWRVTEGARIKKGQPIFDIETDKAVVEIEATHDGRLARIVVPEGGSVAVKKPVAYLAEYDAEVDAYGATPIPSDGGETDPAPERSSDPTAFSPSIPTSPMGGRNKISPAARRLAEERGIDLNCLESGNGPGGRILSTDLVGAPSRKKLTRMRKAIASALQGSKQTIPH